MGKDDKEINSESFLALTVKLPKEIKKDLEDVQDVIKYNGSEEKHKIPHITVVGPRKTFDLDDWKEKIKKKVNEKPTKFKIDSFDSFWNSTKLGFTGKVNGNIGIKAPHIVLFDCNDVDNVQEYKNNHIDKFKEYHGKELEITSIAVIEKGKGIIYEEKINENGLNFDIEQGEPFEQNEEDIKKFYNLLNHEEHTVYQIYRKDGSASQQKFYDSIDEALKVIKKNKLEGLNCFGINERKEGHTTIEDGISKINLILFDIDVKKQVRKQGVSTKKHIKEAYDVARSVRDKLKDLGFEVDLVVFSGNGFHIGLKVNIQLPRYNSKKEWKESLYYRKLEALEDKLKDLETENVEIDSITKDIVRRVKIPGTYNVKEDIPKENYRKAKIIYLNDDIDQKRNKEAFHDLEAKKKQEKNVSRNKETGTENKGGRPSFDKLVDLINEGKIDDPKLVDLYEGNWEGYSFENGHSRSEAEQSLVSKLVFYGFDEVEIKRIMGNCGIGKWQEKGDSYKNNTIEYAKNKQTTIADWESDYKDIEPTDDIEKYEERNLTEIRTEENNKNVSVEVRIHKIKEQPNIDERTYKCINCGNKYQSSNITPWKNPHKPKACDCGDGKFKRIRERKKHGFILKVTEPNKLPTEQTRKATIWVSLDDMNIMKEENGKKQIASILESFGADVEVKGQVLWKIDWKKSGEIKNTELYIVAEEVNRSEKDLSNVEITDEDKKKFKELFRKDQEEIEITEDLRKDYEEKLDETVNDEIEDKEIKKEIKKEREYELYNGYIAKDTVGRKKLKRNIAYVMATPIVLNKENDMVLDYGDGRMMVFGDPGEAKSQSAKRFLKSTLEELGAEKITAEYLSIAGLGGSVKKTKDGFWTIDWGIFPYVNRKGLVLDGIHQFSKKWLSKMREMIEERVIKIIKSAKGEAECSSRIIGISNTNLAPISENYNTNYQASFDLGIGTEDERNKFKGPDRRRWDILWPINKEDVDPEEVDEHVLNNLTESSTERDLETWKKLWAWIWNLDYEDFNWKKVKEFKGDIKETIKEWRNRYPGAEISILGKKGQKIFISYLMASASLHYHLNEEGKVEPTQEDFENVVFLFEDMFDKLEMDKWKRKEKGKMDIAVEIFTRIQDVIQGNTDENMVKAQERRDEFKDLKEIITKIGENPTKPLKAIAKDVGIGRRTLYRRLGIEIDLFISNHDIKDYSFSEGYIDGMVDIEPIVKNGKLTKLGKKVFRLIKKEG